MININKIFVLVGIFLGSISYADLSSDFVEVMKQQKGPFSLNYLQGVSERVEIQKSLTPPKGFLFQAAFRNEKARLLVSKYNFYTANLFSTNYYELQGEFVYNNPFGSHGVDQAALLAKGDVSMGKATSMVQNWVLEKYYVSRLPNSKLSRSFQIRGISDAANELKFANYFFNYYVSAINDDFQYLPVFLLSKQSPISNLSSLDRARNLVAQVYDHFSKRFGVNDPRVKPLYLIRNAVHNQLSPSVITMIDDYAKSFPYYRLEGNSHLFEVRKILKDYFSSSVSNISDLARKLKYDVITQSAQAIVTEGSNSATLLSLSRSIAELRSQIQDSKIVAFEKKAETLSLIARASEYLGKEIAALSASSDKKVYQTVLNCIYAEGFLIKDNYEYFRDELETANDLNGAQELLTDVFNIGMDTLETAFGKVLAQWVSVEPKMENFRDDSIKSSALNLVPLVAQRR